MTEVHVTYYQRNHGCNLARVTLRDGYRFEESWHPGPAPGAWVPTNWVRLDLAWGGTDWDYITEAEARAVDPNAFAE